ncbi:1-phosphatidylinositol- -bisphosphate phosphodiesterase epsilon-1-like protein, partial [Lasius niger]
PQFEFRENRESPRGSVKESEPQEHVPLSTPAARIAVESNTETPSGWSSRSGFLNKPENPIVHDTNSVLDKVALFHKHRHARGRDATTGSLHRTLSVHTTAIEQTYMAEECDENDYHLDLDSYKPVQPIKIDHGVALFPVAAPHTGMDLHLLQ